MFKTCPAKKEISNYLKNVQPSIEYLYNSKKLEQEIAIRIWASTEGNTGISLDKKTGLIAPILKIACAHPELIKQLQFVCRKNGMNMSIVKEKKKWSGYDSLTSKSIKNAINFLKMGGFISDVAAVDRVQTADRCQGIRRNKKSWRGYMPCLCEKFQY